jgi:hypothetical protein
VALASFGVDVAPEFCEALRQRGSTSCGTVRRGGSRRFAVKPDRFGALRQTKQRRTAVVPP